MTTEAINIDEWLEGDATSNKKVSEEGTSSSEGDDEMFAGGGVPPILKTKTNLLIGGNVPMSSIKVSKYPFQCFLTGSQAHVPKGRLETVKKMKALPDGENYRLAHASYPCVPFADKPEYREKALDDITNSLKICKHMGIDNFLVHLPSDLDEKFEENVARVKERWVREKAEDICFILEPLANHPSSKHKMSDNLVLCMIEVAKVMDKHFKNWGFCLDTCHAFQRGVKLSYAEDVANFMKDTKDLPIKVVHLNGSKALFNSGSDGHAVCMSLVDEIWRDTSSGLKYMLLNMDVPFILERHEDGISGYENEIKSLHELCDIEFVQYW